MIQFKNNHYPLPTVHGEKVVLRILDVAADLVGIDQLGLEPEQKAAFLSAVLKPHGMILVTGPTGSGKTISLYTALALLGSAIFLLFKNFRQEHQTHNDSRIIR